VLRARAARGGHLAAERLARAEDADRGVVLGDALLVGEEALKRVKKRDRSALAHALHLRMTALARLSGRPEFNGYATGKTKDGAVYIRDEMIVAAASAPLTAKDERTIEFDPDVIFQLLLKDGRHDGRA
jgi:hypothetical protein